MKLDDCAALVTGAASGLGAATARLLAENGVSVIGLDLAPAIAAAPDETAGVDLIAGDVTDESDVRAALATVTESGPPLRLIVNCAGIGPSRRILSSRGVHDLESFRRTIEVNLVGTFNVLRLGAELMQASAADSYGQRGVIVNTASIAAFDAQIGQVAYAASKGGIVSMTLAAARDLARYGIRVNTIAPGIIDTPLLASLGDDVTRALAESIPFPKRLGAAGEFARLVVMLGEHDYLNGETIRMDGALRMPPQ